MARRSGRRTRRCCAPRAGSRAPRASGRAARRRAPWRRGPSASSPRTWRTSPRRRRGRSRSPRRTPGYCTLTATSRPSGVTARCTCPMLAAATGRSPHVEEHPLGRAVRASDFTTSAASVGAIGAASACSVASASWASSGSASKMKLTSWPAFISTPFISPNSLATSSAVRIANCSSSSARRSAGLRNPRTFDTAKRVELRADSFQIFAERAKRLVSGDDLARCAAAASPAASATSDATVTSDATGATGFGRAGQVRRSCRTGTSVASAIVRSSTCRRRGGPASVSTSRGRVRSGRGRRVRRRHGSLAECSLIGCTLNSFTSRQPGRLRPRNRVAPMAADRRSGRRWADFPLAIAMLLPSAVILGVFVVYPLGRAMWLGQQRCDNFGNNCVSNGWDQYVDVFRSIEFQNALGVTFKLRPDHRAARRRRSASASPCSPTSTCAGSVSFRTVFSSTVATSVAVASLMWLFLLQPVGRRARQHGMVQQHLPVGEGPRAAAGPRHRTRRRRGCRASGPASASRSSSSPPACRAIPRDLHEAAAVDGAGGVRRFWSITLPLLGPTLLFVVVVSTTRAFQAYGEIDLLTGGGPQPENPTTTIPYFIYGQNSIDPQRRRPAGRLGRAAVPPAARVVGAPARRNRTAGALWRLT